MKAMQVYKNVFLDKTYYSKEIIAFQKKTICIFHFVLSNAMFSFWSIDLCSIEAYQQLAEAKGKFGSVACSIESRHALLRKWIRLQETSCQKNPRMRLLHIYHQQHPQQLKATTTPIQDKMVFHHFAGSTATIWMQINTGVKEMHSSD